MMSRWVCAQLPSISSSSHVPPAGRKRRSRSQTVMRGDVTGADSPFFMGACRLWPIVSIAAVARGLLLGLRMTILPLLISGDQQQDEVERAGNGAKDVEQGRSTDADARHHNLCLPVANGSACEAVPTFQGYAPDPLIRTCNRSSTRSNVPSSRQSRNR